VRRHSPPIIKIAIFDCTARLSPMRPAAPSSEPVLREITMHIILGGTGRVGSATARSLLRRGEPVTVVTRDAGHAAGLAAAGARIAVADIHDTARLREILASGTTALLLNPPASPSEDTDAVEHANADAIVAAVEGSCLRKIVAASTYGARPGPPCGDLTVLFGFEEQLRATGMALAVNRGAYYMSNWSDMLDTVRERRKLPSFFPEDLPLPMVAPADLGEEAARRLMEPPDRTGVQYIEGPALYTPRDVADAFADALGMSIGVEVIPRQGWEAAFRKLGFSERAARTYSCMTGTVVDGAGKWPGATARGTTTLREHIRGAVQRHGGRTG
jgi:uncharacterized protein YbjT (DUF2867 family)